MNWCDSRGLFLASIPHSPDYLVVEGPEPEDKVATVTGLVAALATRRRERNLSQADIALTCKVSQATISRIEDGQMDPSARLLIDYAYAVGLNLSWNLTPTVH